ncbi:hypothetical protein CYLTODRAFT_375059 [Cylindrobasidium torrendii FP15055 ss-10]|uniref:GST N-terminal domain-containing protein n=1 Tax=Cylindrobasidium torrendii FP15055 ss-10 TaxID=1314674 RepID=A0A0D7BEF8_9AGAR|nr:hypothetical protein CYLTODRAFT_375059 [Cylindrobasidium torrendii FP15055 ss-10]
MAPAITLFDIPSVVPNQFWSPNTLKARYVLNYKGISFKTEWLEYPAIAPFYKKHGIAHTETKPDGSPLYTLPVIHDANVKKYISGSTNFASYLDATYPNTPSAFPNSTEGLARAFDAALMDAVTPIWALMFLNTAELLNPESKTFFLQTKYSALEVDSVTEWARLQSGFSKVAQWTNGMGNFVMGDTVSFPDFAIGVLLFALRNAFGEDSEEWRRVVSWDGGKWEKLAGQLRKYETEV